MMNNIELLLSCPICEKKYERGSIRLVLEKKDFSLLHIRCNFCGNSSLAVYSKQTQGSGGIITMGIMTDLDYEEACQFSSKRPIAVDELLDFYKANK